MPMPIRVELTQVDSERVVVRASVWLNGEEQDSAFGEAASVEEAEDRARLRLSRLQQEGGDVAQTSPPKPKPQPRKVDVKPPSGSEQQAMAEISPAASTVTSPSVCVCVSGCANSCVHLMLSFEGTCSQVCGERFEMENINAPCALNEKH